MTLSYVPKLLVSALDLMLSGARMLHRITQFAVEMIGTIRHSADGPTCYVGNVVFGLCDARSRCKRTTHAPGSAKGSHYKTRETSEEQRERLIAAPNS